MTVSGRDTPARAPFVGRSCKRPEDVDILRGAGRFLSDLELPDALEAHVLRSPIAHGEIIGIDVVRAVAAPGVVAVFTGYDLVLADAALPCIDMIDGTLDVRQRVLPIDRVRYVGEPIAVIVATDRYRAEDAAEFVELRLRSLPAVVEADVALDGGSLLYPELGTNVVYRSVQRDGDPEAAFAAAAITVSERFAFHRQGAIPLETRGVSARPSSNGRLEVWTSSQIPQMVRFSIATSLGMPPDRIRVIAPRLGGGFGCKENVYPEELIIPAVAMALGKPVRWIEDRREHFVAAAHAREETVDVEACATTDGQVTALRLTCTTDIGAAYALVSNTVATMMGVIVRGPYRVPALDARMMSVVTNKVPLNVLRGAGHPQAVMIMESLLDSIAGSLGLDRIEIRRRNLVTPAELPLDRNTTDCLATRRIVYDEGDYPKCFETALALAGLEEIEQQRRTSAERGRLLGVGFCNHVEISGIGPYEDAKIRVTEDGRVTIFSPIVPMGQGPEITQRQIVADELGLDIEDIAIEFGDTDVLPTAIGAFASRGAAVGGAVVRMAAKNLKEALLDCLATRLDCTRAEVTWDQDGVRGPFVSGEVLSFPEVVRRIGEAFEGRPIMAEARLDEIKPTYSYASHIAFVEVDLETWQMTVPRYIVAHDCGTVINPMLVEGQIVGGVVQGLGELLRERLGYDEDGNPQANCLMDYVLPGVGDLPPDFRVGHLTVPSTFAPFGVRGIGEGGLTGCYGAVATALADAMKEFGRNISTSGPFTPSFLLRKSGCDIL